jgi:quinoprotein glucose dehydrogenase
MYKKNLSDSLLVMIVSLLITSNTHPSEQNLTWTRSGGGDKSLKYSSLSQINVTNINDLEIAWRYSSGNTPPRANTVQTNPVFNDGILVTTSLDDYLIGINAKSGTEKWKLKLPSPGRRGLTIFDANIYTPTADGIHVVDLKDGKINYSIGSKGKFGNDYSYLPPIVTSEVVVSANLNGVLKAYSRKNGKELWTASLTMNDITPRLWSGFSYDEESGLLFVVSSNPGDLVGNVSKAKNYSCSLVAIYLKDGRVAWQFQEVVHDTWDLDVVGAPFITTIRSDRNFVRVVGAVSKTGNTLLVNIKNGKPIFKPEWQRARPSEISSIAAPSKQLKINLPQPFSKTYFDLESDITTISKDKNEYVRHKLRNAKSGDFLSPSPLYDVVFFGLHGGAQWPGAAVDPTTNTMVVPSNNYPWILRLNYVDTGRSTREIGNQHKVYSAKCAACHGSNLAGKYMNEFDGDLYYPPLVGITKKREIAKMLDIEQFRYDHKYAFHLPSYVTPKRLNDFLLGDENSIKNRILNRLSTVTGIAFQQPNFNKMRGDFANLKSSDLASLYGFFRKVDEQLDSQGELALSGMWQLLLDGEGLPGTNPPWGNITAIDLNTGNTKWSKPFGESIVRGTKQVLNGDMNFGGALITKGGLVFASGTRDKKSRAFNVHDGRELWQVPLEASGSAPPMSYFWEGCQYIVFTITGGRFVGFGPNSNSTIAFKLSSCS